MNKWFKSAMVFGLGLALATPTFAAPDNKLPLNGTHYNLNLLGKDNCPGGEMIDSNRHSIFVKLNFSDPDADNILGNVDPVNNPDDPSLLVNLDKTNKIFLYPGTDFQVTDGNACNKGGAAFTLPSDVATTYQIFVRELGKPGGTGDIVTCGISAGADGISGTADDEVVCSTGNEVELVRKAGKPVWQNVTRELTTVDYLAPVYDEFGNVTYSQETANLFDPDFYQYLWDFDNNGLRLVQLRFYPSAQ